MGTTSGLARTAFRKYATDGVPATGANKPNKDEIIVVFDDIDDRLDLAESAAAGDGITKQSWTALNAVTVTRDGQSGAVYNDDTGSHIDPVMPATSAVTFTNGSPTVNFTAHPDWVNGIIVVLTTTGTLPTNFSPATVYYVQQYNPSTGNANLSATPTGSGITAGSAGSGTHTANQFVTNNGLYTGVLSANDWRWVSPDTVSLKANKSITLTAAGLVTGGGDISANRTFTVTAASDAETITGSLTTKATTPASVKAAIDAALVASGTNINALRMTAEYDAAFIPPKLVIVGDSITQPFCEGQDPGMTGADKYGHATYTSRSVWGWLRRLHGMLNIDTWYDKLSFVGASGPGATAGVKTNGANMGCNGSSAAQYDGEGTDTRFAEILRQSAHMVSVALGTNDVSNGTSAADISDYLLSSVLKTARLGKPTLIWTIPPRGLNTVPAFSVGGLPPAPNAMRTVIKDVNNLIRGWASSEPNVFLVDPFTALNNGVTSEADAAYTVMDVPITYDGLHFTSQGEYAKLAALLTTLKKIGLPRRKLRPYVHAGNILPNYRMDTGVASAQPYVSGTVPTGFDIIRVVGTPTVDSLVVPGVGGGTRIRISSNAAETTATVVLDSVAVNITSLALVGIDMLYPYIKIDFSNASNAANYWQHMSVQFGPFSVDGMHDGNGPEWWPEATTGMVLMGPHFFAQTDMGASWQWRLHVKINGFGRTTGYGEIIIREMGLMKVVDNDLKVAFSAPALRGYDNVFYDTAPNFFAIQTSSP